LTPLFTIINEHFAIVPSQLMNSWMYKCASMSEVMTTNMKQV